MWYNIILGRSWPIPYGLVSIQYPDDESVVVDALDCDAILQVDNGVLIFQFMNADQWATNILVHVLCTGFPTFLIRLKFKFT